MKIIGHRGAKGLAPENTVASLRKALEHHVDEIEFDVRVTYDNVPILSHNLHITDQSGTNLLVAKHTYQELKSHKPDLATFDEALKAVDRTVPVCIEIKPNEVLSPIVAIIKSYLAKGWQAGDFRLASYSQPILLSLHAVFPDIQTVVIENWSGARATWRARQLNTKRLSMLEYWLWTGFIRPMARRGYELYSFPPKDANKEKLFGIFGLSGHTNNPKKARKWAKAGLAGVITDYPDRFDKSA